MKCTGVINGLVLLSTLLVGGPARSQEAEEKWTFTPAPGGTEIVKIIDMLEKETGVNVLLDPAAPQIRGRKIEIKGTMTIPRSKIFSWVRSILSFQRLILAPVGPREGNTWQLCDLNAPQVTNHPEWVPADELADWADKDGAYIVSVITLKHLEDTSRARNALAQLSTRQIGRINDIPQTRSFVIGDFAPVVVAAWRMLTLMDDEAAKMTPEDRKRLDAIRRPTPKAQDTRSETEKKIDSYERLLASSNTSHAAQYFLTRILELKTELMEEQKTAAEAADATE